MKTIVIRIRNRPDGQADYPVSLEHYDPIVCEFAADLATHGYLDGGIDATAELIAERLRDHGNDTQTLTDIGAMLYGLMAATAPGQQWFDMCAPLDNPSAAPALRTYLDIEPENLARLPWELMVTGRDQDSGVFWWGGHRPLRGSPVPLKRTDRSDISLPIRVLVVICDGVDPGYSQDEVDAIFAALGNHPGIWQIYVLRDPSSEKIRDTLKEFKVHILHLIGETFGAEAPEFRIRDSERDSESLSVERLQRMLYGLADSPLLFVLNGCRTAQMVLSDRYKNLGSRAVVANHGIVYGEAAVLFAKFFYTELAASGKPDEAMWKARAELLNMEKADLIDWAMPVLTVYGAPEDVIFPGLKDLTTAARQIILSGSYGNVALVVDRFHTRDKVWKAIYGEDGKHLILVTGTENSGKTQLLRSCLLTCKLRGSLAILLDMDDVPREVLGNPRYKINIRHVLRYICYALLREEAMYPGMLTSDTASRLRVFDAHVREIDTEALDDRDAGRDADSPFAGACRILIGILSDIASGSKLIIAFDHAESIYKGDLTTIGDHLLQPIATTPAGQVSVVIAIREKALGLGHLGWIPQQDRWVEQVEMVELPWFTTANTIFLGREFSSLMQVVKNWPEKMIKCYHEQIKDHPKMNQGIWPPGELFNLAELVKQLVKRGV